MIKNYNVHRSKKKKEVLRLCRIDWYEYISREIGGGIVIHGLGSSSR